MVGCLSFPSAGPISQTASLAFTISQLSTSQFALEPTLSFAPNGTIWYSGMDDVSTGNLWYALSDTSSFAQDPDPPTPAGDDAVVHHDADGRLFWATLDNGLRASWAVRTGLNWKSYNSGLALDRPWFKTITGGTTYLAVLKLQAAQDSVAEVWKYSPSSLQLFDPHFTNIVTATGYTDFANHTDGRIYFVYSEVGGVTSWRVAHRGTSESSWSFSDSFSVTNTEAFKRLAIDRAGNVYVVYADVIGGDNSLWLRHLMGSGSWSAAKRLCETGVTCSHPGPVAGSAGKLGVGWYETDGNYDPSQVPSNSIWRYRYGVFENANGSISVVERSTVKTNAHIGPINRTTAGDFSFGVLRMGDSQGKVALAFTCYYSVGCNALANSPYPMYAVQTAGPGLL